MTTIWKSQDQLHTYLPCVVFDTKHVDIEILYDTNIHEPRNGVKRCFGGIIIQTYKYPRNYSWHVRYAVFTLVVYT